MEHEHQSSHDAWPELEAESFRALRSRGVGVSSTQFVDHLGVLGPDCHIAHGVYMTDRDRSLLRARGESQRTGILSTYISHGVFRGVMRGRILAAPTDFPVIQGRLGIEMATRALEGKLTIRHAGPAIQMVTPETAEQFDRSASLAPASFLATFLIEGEGN